MESVVEAFQAKASEKNVNIGQENFPFFSPTSNAQMLEKNTVELLQQQKQINELIKNSLLSSAELLSGEDVTIFIMPLNPENTFPIQKMEGISGVALSENAILLQIDPSFSENALEYAVAHEYHHKVNIKNNDMTRVTLLDSVVFEGKADSFAKIIYPEKNAPWIEPLSGDSQATDLHELQKNAHSFDSTIYYEFFNGNASKSLPLWSNYKIGYQLMQSYLENHSGVSSEEWTKLNGIDILEGSEFNYLLNDY
ncbi:DUF2268 domain-containing protein [Bacillus sp. 2205SS5-2]|uniref:DUF2268 domain-containing protein n=1 Tax=Bacillus sp. 2205SS5-2 TaxID=3109031 RepID=UPI003004FEC9